MWTNDARQPLIYSHPRKICTWKICNCDLARRGGTSSALLLCWASRQGSTWSEKELHMPGTCGFISTGNHTGDRLLWLAPYCLQETGVLVWGSEPASSGGSDGIGGVAFELLRGQRPNKEELQ